MKKQWLIAGLIVFMGIIAIGVTKTLIKPEGAYKLYYGNGNLREEGIQKKSSDPYAGRILHGPYKKYYESGKLQETGVFNDGQVAGSYKVYYESGKLRESGSLNNGAGSYKTYDESGPLQFEGTRKNGKPDGAYKSYFNSGKLQGEGFFKDGQLEGQYKVYHPNGKVREEGFYTNGKLEGKIKLYDENGVLGLVDTFKNGEKNQQESAGGASIQVLGFKDPADSNMFFSAKQSGRLVAVNVLISNGSGEPISVNPMYIVLVDEEGFLYQYAYGVDGEISAIELGTGEKVKGWVGFELPGQSRAKAIKYTAPNGLTLQTTLEVKRSGVVTNVEVESTVVLKEKTHVNNDVCKVDGISIDGAGAAVFIAHNKDFEPVTVGARICGGEVMQIYAPREPDGITPNNSTDVYDYRVRMRFSDGERILKNGDYISGEPQATVQEPVRTALAVKASTSLDASSSVGHSYYKKLCGEVSLAFDSIVILDTDFGNKDVLEGYKSLLSKAKDAYSTTDLADKERMRKVIVQGERREREISKYLAGLQKLETDRAKYLEVVASIRREFNSPETLSKWLHRNVRYDNDVKGNDYWQTPYETISKRSGDCEDYAFLAQDLLSEIGISSRVIAVSYRKGSEKTSHAICLFKGYNGYEYFSGAYLKKQSASSIEALMNNAYPTWYTIAELDPRTKTRIDISKK